MQHRFLFGVLLAAGMLLSTAQAAQPHTPAVYKQHPELLEKSKEYSREVVKHYPEANLLLRKLGLSYMHQLDPQKVYRVNLKSGEVDAIDRSVPMAIGLFTEFGDIGPVGGDIAGVARTTAWCPLSGQLAEVSGFLASVVSKDPAFGIRPGTLIKDDFLETIAQVNFRVLMLPKGAKDPKNRSVMETTHEASCGDDVFFSERVATWPGLRISMAVDDTGSMSSELAGVKGGLASFITSQSSSAVKRDVSYELITFKDAPSLVLPNTTDTSAALAAVQSLYPSGGGDCPEDAIGALSLAVNRAASDENAEGAVVLVTDASPRGGDVGGLIAAAQAAGIKVHVLLSGDCVGATVAAKSNGDAQAAPVSTLTDSSRVVFERIARETGGLYYYAPGRTATEYAKILDEIFRTAYVGDNEPPVVSVSVSPGELWPPNHQMVRVSAKVSATDNVDPSPTVELESVTSTEPDNGVGDGDTTGDIQIAADGTISLRAERSAMGPGRIYTIKYRATDTNGNVGYGTAEVVVPRDSH